MPRAIAQKTRQRSATPTELGAQVKQSGVELTPGWSSSNPDIFKEPAFLSPLKTRTSTRRQSMYIKANAVKKPTVSKKKPAASSKSTEPSSVTMAQTRPSSSQGERRSHKKKAPLKSPPSEPKAMPKKTTRGRSSSQSRSTKPHVERGRSASPHKKVISSKVRSSTSTSKIPVKDRDQTPSRSAHGRMTRSRSRSRTRMGTPLERPGSASRKVPSSRKREERKQTPTRAPTPTRQVKKAIKRPASPTRPDVDDMPIKAAKVLGKSAVKPARATGSASDIRYSRRLAAKQISNTSIVTSQVTPSPKIEAPIDNGKGYWRWWCTIL